MHSLPHSLEPGLLRQKESAFAVAATKHFRRLAVTSRHSRKDMKTTKVMDDIS